MVDWLTIIYTSVPWATILSLALYFIKNPEKAEKWESILARSVSYWSQRAERKTVGSDIQSDINLFSKTLNEKAGDQILPDGIKIRWEKSMTSREAFLRENRVIVKMSHHRNQARNFLNATLSYVTTGLLPNARYHLDPIVRRSLDLTIIRKILSEKKRNSALQMFFEEVYEPEKTQQPLVEKYNATMEALDEQRMLTVILREFSDLGLKMYQKAPNDDVKKETKDFLEFADKIATREPRVDVPLDFKGDTIRSSIILIARPELAARGTAAPFMGAVLHCVDEGASTVYVAARGRGVEIARKVGNAFEASPIVRRVSELEKRLPFYKGRRASSIIIVLKSTR